MSHRTSEITGTYGSGNTPCTVLILHGQWGDCWYCVKGSQNINHTWDDLTDKVNVEALDNDDWFIWSSNIETTEQLAEAVSS